MNNVLITLDKQIEDINASLRYYKNRNNVMDESGRQKTICELERIINEYETAIKILNDCFVPQPKQELKSFCENCDGEVTEDFVKICDCCWNEMPRL